MGLNRRARAALAVLLIVAVAGCAAPGAPVACTGDDAVPWRALAPGVWVWDGATAEPAPANAGHVVPTTAVIHGRQALLIDPGPNLRHAQRARRSLLCRFGVRVSDVVNTHAHAENVLGNAAFADDLADGTVRIWSTAGTREGMAQRCPDCLQSLTRRAGTDAMQGTRIVLPTHTLAEGDTLARGPHRLRVMRVEQGHTDADLVLWLPEAGVLWAGGLVVDGRLPEFAQGTLDGWLSALQRLASLRPRVVVGMQVGDAGAIAATQQYLVTLRRRVLEAMDAGRLAGERQVVPMAEWSHWAGHERQDFNTQRVWRELEPVWMGVPGKP